MRAQFEIKTPRFAVISNTSPIFHGRRKLSRNYLCDYSQTVSETKPNSPTNYKIGYLWIQNKLPLTALGFGGRRRLEYCSRTSLRALQSCGDTWSPLEHPTSTKAGYRSMIWTQVVESTCAVPAVDFFREVSRVARACRTKLISEMRCLGSGHEPVAVIRQVIRNLNRQLIGF